MNPAGHARPHAPQCFGFEFGSTHVPAQQSWLGVQAAPPPHEQRVPPSSMHVSPATQTAVAQLQRGETQVTWCVPAPAQSAFVAQPHTPSVHLPDKHGSPQRPQAFASHPSSGRGVPGRLQFENPGAHVETQTPPTHARDPTCSPEQARSQAPQWSALVASSASHPSPGSPLQSAKPGWHPLPVVAVVDETDEPAPDPLV
jgi:hypothetical protein